MAEPCPSPTMLPAGAIITAKQLQQFQVSFCFDAGDKNLVKLGGHWSCNYGNISGDGL